MNDMRNRLIELIMFSKKDCARTNCRECAYAEEEGSCIIASMADFLLTNGVIVPPCKVGDSCYPLWHSRNKPVVERKISRITYSARNVIIGYYENDGQYRPPLRTRVLGVDVFLTSEEAERALKERE